MKGVPEWVWTLMAESIKLRVICTVAGKMHLYTRKLQEGNYFGIMKLFREKAEAQQFSDFVNRLVKTVCHKTSSRLKSDKNIYEQTFN